MLLIIALFCFCIIGSDLDSGNEEAEQKLKHPLSELFGFPEHVERQLSVVWALGSNENVKAIKKGDYEALDVNFVR